jgi:cytochrome b561
MSEETQRYTRVAILLHWVSALCVLGLLGMGLLMVHGDLAPMRRFQLYQWHKSVGITVLLLTVLRLAWRLGHKPPPHPDAMPARERRAASAAHRALYGLLVGLPLAGWALVSLSPFKIPTVLFGQISWPHLPLSELVDPAAGEAVMKRVHAYGAWFLGLLVLLHVAAALRHHWVLRDAVLRRMAPVLRDADSASPTRSSS